jgi:hypothetical protein
MCVCVRERERESEEKGRMSGTLLLLVELWFQLSLYDILLVISYLFTLFQSHFLIIHLIISQYYFIFFSSDIAFGMAERIDRIFLKTGTSLAVRMKQINGQCCVRTKLIRNFLRHDQVN